MTEHKKGALAQMANELAAKRGLDPAKVYDVLQSLQDIMKSPQGRYLITSIGKGLSAEEAVEDVGRFLAPPPQGSGEAMRDVVEKARHGPTPGAAFKPR